MAADGSIVISVDADDKKAQAELSRLSTKIKNINDQIEGKTRKKSYLEEQAKQIKEAYRSSIYSGQDEKAQELEKQYTKVQNAIERINEQLRDHNDKLDIAQSHAGELSSHLAESAKTGESAGENMANGFNAASSAVGRLQNRILGLAKRVFVFSLITSGLRSVRDWIRNTIMADSEATAAIAQLKGAFLTLAQPLLQVVIPAFVTFVNILTQIVSAIASVISALFGTTVQESAKTAKKLYGEQKAIKGVGEAAKKSSKSLLAFDEINKLEGSGDSGTSGGGTDSGVGAAGDIAPDFSFVDSGISERLQEIAKWIFLIGVGFATWKIAENIDGPLGELIKKIAGLAIAIGGVMIFIHGFTDAWNNGVNWPNIIEMVGGLAAAVFGLWLAFGKSGAAIALVVGGLSLFAVSMKDAFENGVDWPNAIGMVLGLAAAVAGLYALFGPVAAGIALVVGGIAMLVTAFSDAMASGWNLQNTFLAIAGILATGLGFFFLTGSVIPLLIAAIASLLLVFTIATGHGEELIEGIRTVIEGFKEFFTGIFTGDMEKAINGLKKIFEGLKTAVHAVIDGIKDFFLNFLDWLDEKTDGRFHGIIQCAKDIVNGFFETVSKVADDVIDALKGIVEFITGIFTMDFDLAWEGIKDTFKGIVNAILDRWGGGINIIIKALNFLIEKMNTISFDVPDWVPGVGGNQIGVNIPKIAEYEIPHLARGAVIPPNREFLAVLGDQTNGNNIEAPESLLRQMAAEAASVNTSLLQEIIQLMKDGKVLVVNDTTFAELVYKSNERAQTRHGGSLVSVRSR